MLTCLEPSICEAQAQVWKINIVLNRTHPAESLVAYIYMAAWTCSACRDL